MASSWIPLGQSFFRTRLLRELGCRGQPSSRVSPCQKGHVIRPNIPRPSAFFMHIMVVGLL
jgi:hypothetical protein